MLPGTNTIELNTSTMIEIVQYYFDNKMFNPHEPKPKVTHVEEYNALFKVLIQQADKPEPKP